MFKKILAFFVFSMLLHNVVSASFYDLSDSTGVPQALYLSDLGIIASPQNTSLNAKELSDFFRLEATITRKEVMKIVMKLSGKQIDDTCRGEFSDVVSDWGCKYIESALDAGYIAANSTFRPDDNITKTEAMKLILKSKGIKKVQETSAWQEDYMMTAYEYGIVQEKYYDFDADATRGWIFKIATATIKQIQEIEKKGGIISDEAM